MVQGVLNTFLSDDRLWRHQKTGDGLLLKMNNDFYLILLILFIVVM